MKRSIIILFTVIVFWGCETLNPKIESIPENKKPILQNEDVIYFTNYRDNNLMDTFIIARYEDQMMYDRDNIFERIILNYENINKEAVFKNIETHLAGVYNFVISDYIPSTNYEMFDIEIDNMKYSVFTMKNISRKTNLLPDSIFYSYKDGILRYYYSDTIYNRKY